MSNGTVKGSTLGLRTEDEAARRDRGIERVPIGNASPAPAIAPSFKNLLREIFISSRSSFGRLCAGPSFTSKGLRFLSGVHQETVASLARRLGR
jgi:hypothetical protein